MTEREYIRFEKVQKCKQYQRKPLILQALSKWAKKWNKITERKQSKFEKCKNASSEKENKQYRNLYGSERKDKTGLLGENTVSWKHGKQ